MMLVTRQQSMNEWHVIKKGNPAKDTEYARQGATLDLNRFILIKDLSCSQANVISGLLRPAEHRRGFGEIRLIEGSYQTGYRPRPNKSVGVNEKQILGVEQGRRQIVARPNPMFCRSSTK